MNREPWLIRPMERTGPRSGMRLPDPSLATFWGGFLGYPVRAEVLPRDTWEELIKSSARDQEM
jgi:hypothetical protein